MLEVRVLGGFGLLYQGQEIETLRPGRAQSLLVYLLLHRDAPQPRSRIAADFWPDTTEAQARTNLRREIHALRKALPESDEFLLVESQVVQWKGRAAWEADLARFQAALGEGDFETAVGCYGGELLPGCYEEWLLPHRERLHADYCQALERFAEEREDRGDHAGALVALRTLVAAEPLREELYRQMMGVCLRAGDRAQLAAIYRECQQVLMRELELEPDPETQEFYQRAIEAPTTDRQVDSKTPPLLGREQEWRVALRWLDNGLREGFGELLLVTGEPGIGKTRLLEELKAETEVRGGLVVAGRGFEAEQIRAYGPWLDAFKQANLLRPERVIESGDRSELFDPVVSHIRRLAEERTGLLLVFDDLHWFDEASLALLHYATRLLTASRVLVAGSARSAELPQSQARRVVSSLKRDGRLKELPLGPLDEDAVRRLAGWANPNLDVPLDLGSGGNPLFAVELARAAGFRDDTTVDDLVAVRLECLEALPRELVSWGAVLGRSFTLETLATVCSRPLVEILEAVVQLEEHSLWRPSADGYDFAHDVVREAAYRGLSEPRRRLLHLQAARRLTEPAEVARHATLGGEVELACEAYLKASVDSLRILAFSEAAELARRGLELCQADDDPTRRLQLIRTAIVAGLPVEAMQGLTDEVKALSEQAARRGIPEEEALAGQVQSVLDFHLNRADSLEAASMRTVEKARGADLTTAARMVAHSASCLACVGRDMVRAEAVALEAQELAGQAGIQACDVEHSLGLVKQFQGDLVGARDYLERAVALSRRAREPWQTCLCLVHLGCLLVELEEYPAVAPLVEEIRRTASPLKDESELAFADLLEALAARGDPSPQLEVMRRIDSKRMFAFGHRIQARRCLAAGDLRGAVESARQGWQAAEALNLAPEQGLCGAILAEASLKLGERQAAAEWLRRARKLDVSRVGPRAVEALRRAVREGERHGHSRRGGQLAGAVDHGGAL